MLINNQADMKIPNSEGLTALDYVFARDMEQVKDAIRASTGVNDFEILSRSYSEEKLSETRKVTHGAGIELLKVHDVDTIADTTMFSGTSEMLHSVDAVPKHDQLKQKIKDLQEKSLTAQIRLNKLRKHNSDLKRHIKEKAQHNVVCVEQSRQDNDPTVEMINGLTTEIESYTNYIDNYRRASEPFFEDIYDLMLGHIRAFFGDHVSVAESGSYENGLLMPWSDLNLVVTFHNDTRAESKHRNSIIDGTKKFSKILQMEQSTVQNCLIEERTSLMILKIKLTKRFKCQNVEIIFKYYVNPSYPNNEEIVNEYLDRYAAARPLYIAFRTILHQATLDDPSMHGLKSAVIFLMIVAYLQHMENTGSKPISSTSIGELFLNFLFFYSYGFDYYRDCIQCYPISDAPTPSFMLKDPHRKINSLMVLNPYNADIILTKSFKRTAELKQLIRLCYISLFNKCSCSENKTIKIKPKLTLKPSPKRHIDDSFADIYDQCLDRYKPVDIKYVNQLQRKAPKLSMHIEPESVKETPRTSFAIPQQSMQEFLCDELEVYRPVSTRDGTGYMIQSLFNFNFNHCVHI